MKTDNVAINIASSWKFTVVKYQEPLRLFFPSQWVMYFSEMWEQKDDIPERFIFLLCIAYWAWIHFSQHFCDLVLLYQGASNRKELYRGDLNRKIMQSIYLTLKSNKIVNLLVTNVNLWLSWSTRRQKNLYHLHYIISKLKQWRLIASMNTLLLWESNILSHLINREAQLQSPERHWKWKGVLKHKAFHARRILFVLQILKLGYRMTGERCQPLPFLSLKNKQLKKCTPDSIAPQYLFHLLLKSI